MIKYYAHYKYLLYLKFTKEYNMYYSASNEMIMDRPIGLKHCEILEKLIEKPCSTYT
jgi:hypothetical protein